MIYYIIWLSMILIAVYVCMAPNRNKRVDIVACRIFGFVLFVLAAFRYRVGYDYLAYQRYYELSRRFSRDFMEMASRIHFEWGYLFLMWIAPSFGLLIILCSAAAVIPKIIYIEKETDVRIVCMLMYFMSIFLPFDMGIIRQGISIAILLFSIKYAINKEIVKFGLLILLASLFHVTALVFIPMYFIANHEYAKKQYYIVAAVSLVLFVCIRADVLISVARLIPIELLQTKVIYYATVYDPGMSERITYITMIKRILVLILFVEILSRQNKDEKSVFYLNAYTLSVFVLGMCGNITAIFAGRGLQSLYFMQTFLFARTIYNTKKISYRFILLMVILLVSYPNFRILLEEGSVYLPYTMNMEFWTSN